MTLEPFEQDTALRAVTAPNANRDLAALGWSAAAILLAFFCFAHLGVLICFAAAWRVSPIVAPAALVLSLASGDWLAHYGLFR